MTGNKFSLRYKLAVLMTSLTVSMLVSYMITANLIYKDDKIVHIIENHSNLVRTVAAKIRIQVDLLNDLCAPMLRGFDFAKADFNNVAQEVFSEQNYLHSLGIIKFDQQGKYSIVNIMKKSDFVLGDEGTVHLLRPLLDRENSLSLFHDHRDKLFHYAMKVDTRKYNWPLPEQDKGLTFILVASFLSSDLAHAFDFRGSSASYLIGAHGQLLLGPHQETGPDFLQAGLRPHMDSILKILSESPEDHGHFEGPAEVAKGGGESLAIYTYSRVGRGKLLVLHGIGMEEAIRAFRILFWRSVAILSVLILMAVLISFWAASNVTLRMRDLSMAAEEAGQGRFDVSLQLIDKFYENYQRNFARVGTGISSGIRTYRTYDEVDQFAHAFSSMIKRISQLLNEVQDYSRNLELKVEERTHELKRSNHFIKTMMESLGQGLLVFDRQGMCLSHYTKTCEQLFEISPEERRIQDILRIADDEKGDFEKWLRLLFAGGLPFADMAALGPQEWTVDGGNEKVVHLEYHPLQMEEQNLDGVLLVATDKTAEIVAKREAKFHEEYAQRVIKIAKNKRDYINFIRESRSIISRIGQRLESGPPGALDEILLLLHSLKGGLALYSVHEVRSMVHQCEERVRKLGPNNPGILDLLKEEMAAISSQFEVVVFDCHALLGEVIEDQSEKAEIRIKDLENFSHLLHELHLRLSGHPELFELSGLNGFSELCERFQDEFLREPIASFFGQFNDLIAQHAEAQGKKVGPLEMVGGDIRIRRHGHQQFFQALAHAFINAIDHGLEGPEERALAGKPIEGHIKVLFSRIEPLDQYPDRNERETFLIKICDDGRGLDLEKIRRKLMEKSGLIGDTRCPSLSDEEVIMAIFDPQFSTAEEVTISSGRGLGMSAIKAEVERLGGQIKVETERGMGTSLHIQLPYI